jgi:tripartite-type tricarboxylate transporter receptor subunit TctC
MLFRCIIQITTSSRLLLACGAMLASVALGQSAFAQDASFPSKSVRMIVPYAPGGLPDTMARIMAQRMSESMGQQVVIENRPGAGGIAACEAVARAAPDGYTLLIADVGQVAINPALYPKLPYDPQKDFVPISLIGTSTLFLAAHVSVPADSLAELIRFVRANPGKLNYGSSGNGSIMHLATEVLKAELGLDIVHVPYKGTGQSIPALIGGQVSLAYSALPSLAAHIKTGGVKLLAASTARRSPQAPEVPTVAEVTGIRDYHFNPEIGLLAPAGTSATIVARLAAEVARAVRHPDTVRRYNALGIDPVGGTPEEYAATIRASIDKYARAVKLSGAKLD